MCHFVNLLMLSKWTLIVFALPVYGRPPIKIRVRRFDLIMNETSVIDDHKVNFSFDQQNKHRSRSAEKCDEYSKIGGEINWILPLSSSRPIPIVSYCQMLINPLISDGEKAQIGEFPHMAAIGWLTQNRTIVYNCGGSLISDRWILTAAHCTHGPFGKPIVVRLGSNKLSDEKSGQLMIIESIKRHPAYEPPKMYADLALLKLAKSVTFDSNIKPACLHSQFNRAPYEAWVTGWGSTKFVDELSDTLIKAKLDLIDNLRCTLSHNFTTSVPNGVVPSMICAGDPKGGWQKDTCHGDSGGPLQSIHPSNCLYEIVGVTSFGKLCGTPELPGVYTRVSHYLEWIESIVWPDQ